MYILKHLGCKWQILCFICLLLKIWIRATAQDLITSAGQLWCSTSVVVELEVAAMKRIAAVAGFLEI